MILRSFFDSLSRRPGFRKRPGQIRMALAAAEALEARRHLIVEAPTGIGKSLAYLAAALEWLSRDEERRVIVSTWTKALQTQLMEKDIPLLLRLTGLQVPVARAVGGRNYACLRRIDRSAQLGLFDRAETEHFQRLAAWLQETQTGQLDEIVLPPAFRGRVEREADLCLGRNCRRAGQCFWRRARQVEARARLIVANHHLFFAHLASGEQALPPASAVIFDEAHQVEDAATRFLGVRVTDRRARALFDAILTADGRRGLLARLASANDATVEQARPILEACREGLLRLETEIRRKTGAGSIRRHRGPEAFGDPLSGALEALAGLLAEIPPDDDEEEREIAAFHGRVESLRTDLEILRGQELEGHVYWAETGREQGFELAAVPVRVAPHLAALLYERIDSVVLTSATLSTDGRFDFIRDRLGLEQAGELRLESPFDFFRRVLLYLPRRMPDPRSEDFPAALAAQISILARAVRGRTLALFTSYGQLRSTAARLDLPGIDLFVQGEMESPRLVEAFRASPAGLLLGTATFWQGIDIPGEDLQCVVIARLPFSVPEHPLVQARVEEIEAAGGNPFHELQVPEAVLLFRQGFGRLIRREGDRGAVAVLDPRILTKNYGRRFLAALPRLRTTHSPEELASFVNGGEGAGQAGSHSSCSFS